MSCVVSQLHMLIVGVPMFDFPLPTQYTIVKIKTGAAQSSNPATIKEG